ncbi:Ribonuclease U2 [Leucoagaricus sp. SymC.cos]|nr:Ribonuclease U2 [Leucoagaricus sp. SymC.cos]
MVQSSPFQLGYTAVFLVLLAAVAHVSAYTCNCNGRTYSNSDIFDAINLAYQIDPIANPIDNTKFPRRYGNTPTDDYPWCGPGHYVEYPLLPVPPGPYDPTASYALDPGMDRVVYLTGSAKTFCGTISLGSDK